MRRALARLPAVSLLGVSCRASFSEACAAPWTAAAVAGNVWLSPSPAAGCRAPAWAGSSGVGATARGLVTGPAADTGPLKQFRHVLMTWDGGAAACNLRRRPIRAWLLSDATQLQAATTRAGAGACPAR